MTGSHLLVLSADDVRRLLGWDECIALVAEAMKALSASTTLHLPRAILPLGGGRAFGVMAGGLAEGMGFGAKLVSVFPENFALGRSSHQGIVLLHNALTGAPVCIADAGEITRIRTAAASAVATNALARPGPSSLAILGYGHQAEAHAAAIARVRDITEIRIWGRDPEKSTALALKLASDLDIPARAEREVSEAVRDADIIATTTAAKEPILEARHVKPGAHVNLVGSSFTGPVEADITLVACSRFVADCRQNVLEQGAEFRNALAAGAVDEQHIVAEIGDVLAGSCPGRTSDQDITVYKSLGHIVQDLAALRYLHEQATTHRAGTLAAF